MAPNPAFAGSISIQADGYVLVYAPEASAMPACPTIKRSRSGGNSKADLAMHCLNALHKHKPGLLVVNVDGCIEESLSASVLLKKEAVHMLPLMNELVQSTTFSLNPIPFQPPTSIWHLVSLLIVLHKGLDEEMKKWLVDPAAPPHLLAGTLQMADYMGAKRTVTQLCELFTSIFRHLPSISTSTLAVKTSLGLFHQEEVIYCLPDGFGHDVLKNKLNIMNAYRKPHYAFIKWLESQGSTLDLTWDSAAYGTPTDSSAAKWKPAVARAIQNLSQVKSIQVLKVSTTGVKALSTDGFTVGQLRLSGIAQKCYVRTVQVSNIRLGEVPGAFLSQKHPLGVVGEHVTLLSLQSATLGSPCKRGNAAVPEEVARASSRWIFCRAISRLKNLKFLDVTAEFWEDVISYGMDVTAPLHNLAGLSVRNVRDRSVLARFGPQHSSGGTSGVQASAT